MLFKKRPNFLVKFDELCQDFQHFGRQKCAGDSLGASERVWGKFSHENPAKLE